MFYYVLLKIIVPLCFSFLNPLLTCHTRTRDHPAIFPLWRGEMFVYSWETWASAINQPCVPLSSKLLPALKYHDPATILLFSIHAASYYKGTCIHHKQLENVNKRVEANTKYSLGFPGSPVVKNPPANAGDVGLISGPGRVHMPWVNQFCEPQLLSLGSGAHALQQVKPLQREALAPQLEMSPALHNQRKPVASDEDPAQPKVDT